MVGDDWRTHSTVSTETVSKAEKQATSYRVKVGSGADAVEHLMSSTFLSMKSRKTSGVKEG